MYRPAPVGQRRLDNDAQGRPDQHLRRSVWPRLGAGRGQPDPLQRTRGYGHDGGPPLRLRSRPSADRVGPRGRGVDGDRSLPSAAGERSDRGDNVRRRRAQGGRYSVRDDPQLEGLFLSLDVGTSGVKASLFTADGVCHGERSAPLNILTPRPGRSELDLERAWRAAVETSRDLVASLEAGRRVLGIGLSVASPTVVAVDSTGRALCNGLTYADGRAQPRLDRIRDLVGDERYRRLTGNRLALGVCSAAAMLHLSDEVGSSGPGGLRTGHLNSYLICRLTGRWVMDWTNASYTGLVDLRKPGEWSDEACEVIEFPARLLPELVAPWEPIGRLSAGAASELGLERSVMVVAGAADTACSAYGVGCVNDGEVFESAGTSGVLTVCRARPSGSPLFLNRAHVVPGRWLSHGAMSAAGAAVRWLREAIFSGMDPSPGEPDDYAWINAEAAKSVPGSGGVVFLPYLLGERTPVWDPGARGAWVGMSVGTGRHDLVRAVLESAGYGMRQMLEIEESQRGLDVEEVLI